MFTQPRDTTSRIYVSSFGFLVRRHTNTMHNKQGGVMCFQVARGVYSRLANANSGGKENKNQYIIS